MSDTLRDQLLGLGFKPAPKPERPARDDARAPRHSTSTPRRDTHGAHGAHGKDLRGANPASRESRHPGRSGAPPRRDGARPARGGGDIDLAKAFAIRAQKEKEERIAAEAARQLEAQRRREGKAKLAELLKDATLNDAAAEIARHFEYGGKIRRIYVTAAQLAELNGGTLAVVQQGGRYHLVTLAHAIEAEQLLSGALALRVDPDAPRGDDPYADPQYQVPDDLVW